MIPEQTKRLLRLIKEEKTSNEISDAMHITNLQLYKKLTNLKNKGFVFARNYYPDGNIIYKSSKESSNLSESKHRPEKSTRVIPKSEDYIKTAVISDVHLGSSKDGLELLYKVYDYCKNNDIHIIFNCGDLIDGDFGRTEKDIESTYDQINYLIDNYPFDRNILNFCCTGDHDLTALHNSQDITEIVNNYRHDIVFTGYSDSYIRIGNDDILLSHLSYGHKYSKLKKSTILRLNGHFHEYQIYNDKNDIKQIDVPALSTITPDIPTFLELDINIENDYFKNIVIEQLLIRDKICSLNKSYYDFSYRKLFEEEKENSEVKVKTK